MIDRIGKMFAERKIKGKKALITFITAGDPDIQTTKRLVFEMERAGADLVELGIPFSDPVAEGPIIQEADLRALKNGLRIDTILGATAEIRKMVEIPIVFMVYINCVFTYGVERFFRRCSECGVDGVIIPDLPYEEREEVSSEASNYNIKLISLVAPTSHERIRMIAKDAEGFLYCVTSEGVTGIRKNFGTDFNSYFDLIDRYTKVPTALGFGISTPQQAKELQKYADGIIVGSAIVKLIGQSKTADDAVKSVAEFVGSFRKAMDN